VENTSATSFTNTGLSSGTTYYYKVSAYNNGGESSQSSYGSATTAGTSTTGTFTDTRDNKTYKAVKIGNQTWMAENLNFQPSTGNSWCYDKRTENCNIYGRLYDWNTAMGGKASSNNVPSGVQGVCPSGWHLPFADEWDRLAESVGGQKDNYGMYYSTGKALKATSGWNGGGNGTDTYGFSALPGGRRDYGGRFYGADYYGDWWTATEGSSDNAYGLHMYYGYDYVYEYYDVKSDGFSVRCVKD
jgi:uncharacterized protein (TIGR02145 family)